MFSQKNSRIAVFSLAYSPFEGGAEIATREIISRLKEKKFFIFTKKFNRAWPRKESFLNGEIIRVGRGLLVRANRTQTGKKTADYYGRGFSKLLFILRVYAEAKRLHKKEKFDAIWAVMASYSGLAALLFKLRYPKVPFFLTLQEGDSEEFIMDRVGFSYRFWRMIFTRADYISVISHYLVGFAKRHGAICPIEVVPNGVDLNKFKNQNSKIKITNQNSKIIIITTSRLVYKNGVDVLIKAAAELKKISDSGFRLQIIGGGPEEQKLKKLASDLKVEDNVRFLGQIPAQGIPEYLLGADVFVRLSRSEGLGNSFLEAMAAGLPVIGTKVGGIPDFLQDGETGIFAKVDNSKDLAMKIKELLTNKALYKKLSVNGKKLVWEKYGWDAIARSMKNIFNKLKVKKQILFATGIYPPDIGGPASHSKELCERFKKSGFGVKVVTYGEQKGAVSRELPRLVRYFLYFWKVLNAARGADLIYAQDATATGVPAMLVSKFLRKPLYLRVGGDVLWERALERGERFESLIKYYELGFHITDRKRMFSQIKMVFKSARSIAVTASFLKDFYIRFYDVPPEKIRVILNPAPQATRRAAGRPGDEILFAGRFVNYKNLKLIMKAFDAMRKKTRRGELILIGDGPERKNLEKLKTELVYGEHIKILPRLDKKEVLENAGRARVCIAPALTEFNPNFILECLSAGTPAIISRENGLTVQLPDDFQFNPKNGKELEEKLVRFFDDEFYENTVRRISEISLNRTWDDVARESLEFLDR